MAVTRNDWDIIDSGSSDRLVPLRWITGKVRKGDAHTILDALGARFNSEVEPIIKAHSWGYAKRTVRGTSSIPSEHSSGTAVDFNAPAHPIGKANTFSPADRAKIRQIVRDFDGAIRWGGEWSRPDDMHFELIGGTAKLAAVAKKLAGGSVQPAGKPKPTTPAKPAPKPAEAPSRAVQSKLKAMGLPGTVAGVKAFQKQHNLVEDGKWENLTEAKYQYNLKLQKALNAMKSTTNKLTVDGYIGVPSERRIADVLKRNAWKLADLEKNLKKVKAWV